MFVCFISLVWASCWRILLASLSLLLPLQQSQKCGWESGAEWQDSGSPALQWPCSMRVPSSLCYTEHSCRSEACWGLPPLCSSPDGRNAWCEATAPCCNFSALRRLEGVPAEAAWYRAALLTCISCVFPFHSLFYFELSKCLLNALSKRLGCL